MSLSFFHSTSSAIKSQCLTPLKVLHFRTAVVDVQISHHIILGVRKLIWHNLSPEKVKIGHINKRKCEILTTHSVSQCTKAL